MNRNIFILLISVLCLLTTSAQWLLPVNSFNRNSLSKIRLTPIGNFGLLRKARPGVPEHYHTGIDIKRPKDNYDHEPIYPACKGIVISLRDDGPFAQIILEHEDGKYGKLWTVYEHVTGIQCRLGQTVEQTDTIAFFFSKKELDHFGWQFDHLHFEIMKEHPLTVKPRKDLPHFQYTTYALTCTTKLLLEMRLYNPIQFFNDKN